MHFENIDVYLELNKKQIENAISNSKKIKSWLNFTEILLNSEPPANSPVEVEIWAKKVKLLTDTKIVLDFPTVNNVRTIRKVEEDNVAQQSKNLRNHSIRRLPERSLKKFIEARAAKDFRYRGFGCTTEREVIKPIPAMVATPLEKEDLIQKSDVKAVMSCCSESEKSDNYYTSIFKSTSRERKNAEEYKKRKESRRSLSPLWQKSSDVSRPRHSRALKKDQPPDTNVYAEYRGLIHTPSSELHPFSSLSSRSTIGADFHSPSHAASPGRLPIGEKIKVKTLEDKIFKTIKHANQVRDYTMGALNSVDMIPSYSTASDLTTELPLNEFNVCGGVSRSSTLVSSSILSKEQSRPWEDTDKNSFFLTTPASVPDRKLSVSITGRSSPFFGNVCDYTQSAPKRGLSKVADCSKRDKVVNSTLIFNEATSKKLHEMDAWQLLRKVRSTRKIKKPFERYESVRMLGRSFYISENDDAEDSMYSSESMLASTPLISNIKPMVKKWMKSNNIYTPKAPGTTKYFRERDGMSAVNVQGLLLAHEEEQSVSLDEIRRCELELGLSEKYSSGGTMAVGATLTNNKKGGLIYDDSDNAIAEEADGIVEDENILHE